MDLFDNDVGFSDYYGVYEWDQDIINVDFMVIVVFLYNGIWCEVSELMVQLFVNVDIIIIGQILLEIEVFDVVVDILLFGFLVKLNLL